MSFFAALMKKPPATPLSTYTMWNGVLYMALGLSLFAWPGQAQLFFFADPFVGHEGGMLRLIGFVLVVVGWFYFMGGRTGATSFGLATVVDRMLVPVFLLPLGLLGEVDVHLVVPFAVLDPVLGAGAWVIWRRTRAADPAAADR